MCAIVRIIIEALGYLWNDECMVKEGIALILQGCLHGRCPRIVTVCELANFAYLAQLHLLSLFQEGLF